MIVNPFFTSSQIPDEYFCDREEESAKLIRLLTNGNNVVLISPRRMGKTGLIHHCFQQKAIKGLYNTIFIDILPTNSLQEFTFLFGKTIFDNLLPKSRKLAVKFIDTIKSLSGKFTYDSITGAPSFSLRLGDIVRPEYTLEEIFKFLESTPTSCIVAIDEFQQIANYPEKNIEALLRSYIQNCTNCNFIFSGSKQHLMSEMFLSRNRPFYNSTSLLWLDAIPKETYTLFASHQFHIFHKEIDTKDIREMYDRFDGITFYLQKIMNTAFSMTGTEEKCSGEMIEVAINDIINSNATLYMEMMSDIPIRQKELLISISKEEPAEGITSAQFIHRHELSSPSSVQAATKKLLERNLIHKSLNKFYISDKFFAIWLNRTF